MTPEETKLREAAAEFSLRKSPVLCEDLITKLLTEFSISEHAQAYWAEKNKVDLPDIESIIKTIKVHSDVVKSSLKNGHTTTGILSLKMILRKIEELAPYLQARESDAALFAEWIDDNYFSTGLKNGQWRKRKTHEGIFTTKELYNGPFKEYLKTKKWMN